MFRQRSSLGGRGWSWRRRRTRRQRRGGLHQGGLVEEPCARQRASPQPSPPTRGRQSTSNGSFSVIKEPAACTRERSANQPAACLGRGRLRRRAGRRRLGLRGRVVRRRRSWRGLAACSTNVTGMWRHTQLQNTTRTLQNTCRSAGPTSPSEMSLDSFPLRGEVSRLFLLQCSPRAKPRGCPATCPAPPQLIPPHGLTTADRRRAGGRPSLTRRALRRGPPGEDRRAAGVLPPSLAPRSPAATER